MKLDRHINSDGRGKYALLKLRRQESPIPLEATMAATTLRDAGLLQFGNESPGDQFFVIKYKDQFAAPALLAYADAVKTWAEAMNDAEMKEFAEEMYREATAAAHLGNKLPD